MNTARIIHIGNIQKPRASFTEPHEGVVVDIRGISPAILATSYKGTMPRILLTDESDCHGTKG